MVRQYLNFICLAQKASKNKPNFISKNDLMKNIKYNIVHDALHNTFSPL
jgi:hypothetical protein